MIKRTFVWEVNNPPPQNYIWVKNDGRAYEYDPNKRDWVLSKLFNYEQIQRTQSNWNETNPTSPAFIRNKPNLSEIVLKKDVYTKEEVRQLLNNLGLSEFITEEELNTAISAKQDIIPDLEQIRTNAQSINNSYKKPLTGIPESDLSSSVRNLLNKANTALQSFTENDPTVPSWAKSPNKPTYTAQEVGALPLNTLIPTALSDLSEDSYHRFVTDAEKTRWDSKSGFSGDYNDLTNKPSIPASLSDFNEDATHRFVTDNEKSVWNEKQDILVSGTNIKTINNQDVLGSGNININGLTARVENEILILE